VLRALTETKPPLAFWVGYIEDVLVSASHIKGWTVVLDGRLVLPRRWIDINGTTMSDTWTAAQRAVVGIVAMRPGITEVKGCLSCTSTFIDYVLKADLRYRLRLVYDTGELNDVIEHLVGSRILRKVYNLPSPTFPDELVSAYLTFLLIGPRGPWAV
jgi:hypothetical protein